MTTTSSAALIADDATTVAHAYGGSVPIPPAFEQTLARVEALLALHRQLHGTRGRPQQHVSDILRGALVLTIAALDAVVLDAVVSAIPELAKQGRGGKNIEKWIEKEPHAAIECFAARDPHQALAGLCHSKLRNLTFQRAEMIEGVLRDTLDCDPPWSEAAAVLSTSRNRWRSSTVTEKLTGYVERHNRIAHDGDRAASGRTTPIQRSFVAEAVGVVRAVGTATCEKVAAHVAAGR